MCSEIKPDVYISYLENSCAGQKVWASVLSRLGADSCCSGQLFEPGRGTFHDVTRVS